MVESRFPIYLSLIIRSFFFSFLVFLKLSIYCLLIINIIIFFFRLITWIINVYIERLIGNHSFYVQDGFKISLYYFLFSEFIFFFRLFWYYFDSSLVPLEELGGFWLPKGLFIVRPFSVPFLNSLILLRRAIRLTWVHYGFLNLNKKKYSYLLTLLLGLFFLLFQFFEYSLLDFRFSDRVYGRIFFFITGFHGLHVLLGLLFLLINYFIFIKNNFVVNHHLSLEFSIIYWHFVDVIWLYLFIFLYWWSY